MGVLGTLSRMLHTAGASSLLTFVAALHFLSGTRGAQSPVRGGFKAVLRFDTQSSNQNALSIVGIHTHALQHCDSNGVGALVMAYGRLIRGHLLYTSPLVSTSFVSTSARTWCSTRIVLTSRQPSKLFLGDIMVYSAVLPGVYVICLQSILFGSKRGFL